MKNRQEIARLKSLKLPLVIVIGLVLLCVPLFAGQFFSYLMLTFFAYAITVIGFNLLFGYAGLLSFGHALFMAVGAYTAAFLTSTFALPYMELILVAAVIVSAILAALIGALCVRYIKIYFAMLTLAFGMLFYTFLLKFYYLTGGDEGMRVLRPYLLGIDFSGTPKMQFLAGTYYIYAFVILAILTFVMWKIVSSPFGLCLKAIRDNPEKAEYLGVSVKKYRWYAFVISAAYAAVGGALLAPAVGQVDPGLTYWTQSGTLVFMSLLGGFDYFFGPLIGGIVYILLQNSVMSLTSYWRFIFGAILVFVVIVAPGGIAGVIGSLVKRRERRD